VKQYTPKKFTQDQITKLIHTLDDLPEELRVLSKLRLTIWKNPQNKESLHLSHHGWLLCNRLKMQMYKFQMGGTITSKQLLQLERYLVGPYHVYYKGTRLAVLEESDAMMLELHGENIANYLENLAKFS